MNKTHQGRIFLEEFIFKAGQQPEFQQLRCPNFYIKHILPSISSNAFWLILDQGHDFQVNAEDFKRDLEIHLTIFH